MVQIFHDWQSRQSSPSRGRWRTWISEENNPHPASRMDTCGGDEVGPCRIHPGSGGSQAVPLVKIPCFQKKASAVFTLPPDCHGRECQDQPPKPEQTQHWNNTVSTSLQMSRTQGTQSFCAGPFPRRIQDLSQQFRV